MFEDRSKLQMPGFGPPWRSCNSWGKERVSTKGHLYLPDYPVHELSIARV